MEHPSGWLIVPAQSDWRLGDVHGIGSRWVDVLDDPNSGVALYAARQPLEPGTTAEEWLDQNIDLKSADSGICGDMSPQAYQPVEVQGEAGRQITTVCSSAQGVNYYAAALVVHDGSGYLISYARSGGEEPGDDEAIRAPGCGLCLSGCVGPQAEAPRGRPRAASSAAAAPASPRPKLPSAGRMPR